GGGEVVYRSPRAEDEEPLPGFPTLSRRRDLAANVRGAEILGFTRVGGDDASGGLDDVASHRGIVLVLGDELPDRGPEFGGEAELYAYLGAWPSEAAAGAHFVLPITTFAEQEGTFTNHEGRVQRFWPGLQAPGAARPAWLVLHALAGELRGGTSPRSAGEAFRALAEQVSAYGGLSYAEIGTRGALVNEPAGLKGD
nr:molybdopterin-dependent oxidoreductase [Gemmatimonadota bacterium]NIP77727.1 molybdopterin-dependent oxidoreductase [Gemmatimonadota bacterium]NIR76946.1 molybdopterin-dependent oxidoreductase [Gemmatimonadota bacterium]NIU29290.1 molybdopterin-dependent oxidoreductase [Gemmatimonadota bacterium]NIU34367.1 molybdopterin-dependent oxidoreductase [Gemmatimonadota bacterium]